MGLLAFVATAGMTAQTRISMTPQQILLFALLGLMIALMLWGRWRYDLVAFGGLMAAVLMGIETLFLINWLSPVQQRRR